MSWFDSYSAYDDDTLTALANAGLLRRAAKDVEAGKVAWAEQRESDGVIAADGQRVQLDTRGPQQARCDCPAPGLCKHILGAVLWLRGLSAQAVKAAGADAAGPPSTGPAGDLTLDPLAEVLALESAGLFKAAGVAAVRRAATTPVDDVTWHVQGGALVVTLPALGQSCRWVAGAGFAGMVSDVPAAERKAVHLIALAAVRIAHGQRVDWPGATPPGETPDSARLGERERAFLWQVGSTLQELVAGGLSHVGELTSARLLALNMSARGEGLPRLAALLRNLGGTIDLLVRRDHRAQERDALALMARIHAQCAALERAEGELAAALRGRLRRDFDEAQALDLLPLGAHWWQTRGGARGLSLAFWDGRAARLLQATLARPDGSDVAFTRQGAWSTQALWAGGGSAQRVCEAALRLEAPRLAADGRLALGGVTRAQSMPMWRADDPRLAQIGCGDWSVLGDRLRAATGLAADPFDAVLLRVSATRAPMLDEAQQRIDWAVQDAVGRWLSLTIPIESDHVQRVENLDRLMARRAAVHAVLVRIERSAQRTVLMPVAVLSRGDQGQLQVLSLDFADELARTTSLAHRILRMLERRREQSAPTPSASAVARLLAPVLDVLETQAATGRLPFTSAQVQRLDDGLPRLRALGLVTLAAALQAHRLAPVAATLMRAHQLCQWVAELDGLPSD